MAVNTPPFRLTQLRTLKVLLAADATGPGNPLTLDAIAKKAGVSDIIIRSGIGPSDPATTEAHEKRYGFKCLLTRGMVKDAWNAEEGHRYYLTALGKKRAEEARDAGLFTFGKKRVNQYTAK